MWTPDSDGGFKSDNALTDDEILLIDELATLGLGQYNGIRNSFNRTLDLVLCNDIVYVSDGSCDPLVPADPHHGALLITVRFAQFNPLKIKPYKRHLFNKCDYNQINHGLDSMDWVKEFSSRSLDDAVNYFYDVVKRLIDDFVPSIFVKPDNYPKWYSYALKKLIKQKYKYSIKFKKYGNKADEEAFKYLRARVRVLEEQCYRDYIASVENSITHNPKRFWTYFKEKSKSNAMPNSMCYGGSTFTSGDQICNAFSNFFLDNFLGGTNANVMDDDVSFDGTTSSITKVVIHIGEVEKLLLNLDTAKSAGPDDLPATFLIGCASTISFPITLLFRKSIEEGTVPIVWKRAYITPVHKKGPKNDIENYRPISKLCIVSKLFEKLVYGQVYSALKHSFNFSQHGFLKGRSTVSNLVLLNSALTDAMDNGSQLDVVYTDYSKAFDRIQHNLLLRKLEKMGISGDLLRWFASYVQNRSQAVVINNYISSWVAIPSGIPQGSLLGPLLFIIFVNDIEKCFFHSHLLSFADDMKIFSTVSSPSDALLLQEDLYRLERYCALNHLDLNPSKCNVITYTRKRNVVLFDYRLKATRLQRDNTTRDLGVYHDSKLLFDTHIDKIVKKASRALGFVMRTSRDFKNVKTLKILYCAFVRSNLEYASQVWNPIYLKYINRIEGIQKRFLKYICFLTRDRYSSDDYVMLCKKHHLLPLSKRREISDLVFLLKIAQGSLDCPDLLAQLNIYSPQIPIRRNRILSLPATATNYKRNTYMWRASNNFNRLLLDGHDIDLFYSGIVAARRSLANCFFCD